MKKFILPLIAIAAFASCSKDNIIDENRQVIRFDAPFINNATKAIDPSYSDANPINEFQVWGTVKGNSNTAVGLFATNGYGATVTRPDGTDDGYAFDCDETEYWLPSATYNFFAIAGATSVTATNGVPTEIAYTANGTTDLVYATPVTVTTDAAATPTGVNEEFCVPFSFTHLLAKVKFTFNNAFPVGSGIALCVKDIKITNAYARGTFTVGSNISVTGTNNRTEEFGHGANVDATTELPKPDEALIFVPQGTPAPEAGENEGDTEATVHTSAGSNFERLLIPSKVERTWEISFTVEYLKKDIKDTYVVMHSETKESTVKAHFQAGYSYNLVANIENQFTPITFTVDENGVYGFGTGTVTDDDFLNE